MNNEHESQEEGISAPDEEDYYSILNLPRDASNDHIRKSFRELSRLYHPDKHTDEELKREAVKLFTKTKKAYDVLIDPHKRAIYDTTGVRGLETEGWEVVQRTRTPEEIREEFERLARIKRELALEQATKPKGAVYVRINATDIFTDYEDALEARAELWDVVSGVEVSAMGFSQSVEVPLTLRDTLKMSGRLDTRNGAGSGSVAFSLQRTLQWNSVLEGTLSIGEGPSLSVRWYRMISPRLSFTVIPTVHYTPRGIQYGFVSAVSTEFDEHHTGSLAFNAGGNSASMNVSLTVHYPKVRLVVSLEAGIPHSHVGVSGAFNLPYGLVLRSTARVGTFGGIVEYGLDKTVSERTVMAATVSVGIPTGIALKIKVVRGRHTFSFPIQLCDEVIPAPIFYATIFPLVAWKLMKKFIIDPIELEESQHKTREAQEKNRKRMEEARQDAEMAKKLMQAQFERVCLQESGRAGVVILKARYGRLISNGTGEADHRNLRDDSDSGVIDVTVPLQCLVSDSKLVLHSATKSQLVGFYDPCVGEDKQLMVHYKFGNAEHLVTIKDDEPLRIPLAAHRLNST